MSESTQSRGGGCGAAVLVGFLALAAFVGATVIRVVLADEREGLARAQAALAVDAGALAKAKPGRDLRFTGTVDAKQPVVEDELVALTRWTRYYQREHNRTVYDDDPALRPELTLRVGGQAVVLEPGYRIVDSPRRFEDATNERRIVWFGFGRGDQVSVLGQRSAGDGPPRIVAAELIGGPSARFAEFYGEQVATWNPVRMGLFALSGVLSAIVLLLLARWVRGIQRQLSERPAPRP